MSRNKINPTPTVDVAPPTEAAPPPAVAPQTSGPSGKLGLLVDLLRRPEGARIDELTAATGWLPHSVRGAIAGGLKTKHKLAVVSEPSDAGRVYRIAEGDA